ncbi:MAG: hypothetical protein LBQ59_00575 [Candidatus Peribacteria bacterium]|nr:hypothetical protein [Candidatus Peribacteria bacterium]
MEIRQEYNCKHTSIFNSFPDPRVDSRFNLSGCPRMTYEDDIRGKDGATKYLF